MAEVELHLLADVKAARRHKVFADYFAEGGVSGAGVNQELAVLREACREQ